MIKLTKKHVKKLKDLRFFIYHKGTRLLLSDSIPFITKKEKYIDNLDLTAVSNNGILTLNLKLPSKVLNKKRLKLILEFNDNVKGSLKELT